MATVNERVKKPQAITINGVDAGGAMTARIQAGYDNVMRSSPDGLELALKDKEIEFVRGTIVTQDWVEFLLLLQGAVGTFVFYERQSGVAAANGYIMHTLTAPVIHRARMSFTKGGYAQVTFDFECRAADETKGIADMWAMTDDSAAPSPYMTAARGGYRIETAVHGTTNIRHVTAFEFGIAMNLVKACNDADVGYTCVDAEADLMVAEGSITFQEHTIATAKILGVTLLTAANAALVLTITQSQGAADKTITIAGVDFNDLANNSDAGADFTDYTLTFDVANNATTPLTLDSTTAPVIAIA